MAQLSGQLVNATLGGFLITPNNTGITGTIQQISDGNGLGTALGLSTAQVNCSNVTFNGTTVNLVTGTTLTITPAVSMASNLSVGGNLTVTGTFTGSIGTAGIADHAITYAKIQQVAANSFLGNTTGSAANVAEISFPIPASLGGTGTNSVGTANFAGNFSTLGAFTTTLTAIANTTLTLPVTGTLSTLSGNETLTNKTLTNPRITEVLDPNGNDVLNLVGITSAVNAITISNSATTTAPIITATGTDTNISLELTGKGTSGVLIKGQTSGTAVASGFLGEVITSTVLQGSAINITNTAQTDLTSVSLTAGVWKLTGNANFIAQSSLGTATSLVCGFNTTSATLPDIGLCGVAGANQGLTANVINGACSPALLFNLSATTTIHFVVRNQFSSVSINVCGTMSAERIA